MQIDAESILPYSAHMAKVLKPAIKAAFRQASKPTTKTAGKPAAKPPAKLSKSDPEFYSKLGQLGGPAVKAKYGTNHFSELARKSHPRAEYHGGRPRKVKKAA